MNHNKTLVLMRGLPGSGKSTIAKQSVANGKGSVVRVNKDELRAMIFPGLAWNPKHEDAVVSAQVAFVRCLNQNKNVSTIIVDDTNFNPKLEKMWTDVALEERLTIQTVFINTPVETCIANDLKRKSEGGHYVGADVIRNMAAKYGLLKQEKEFVIFDLDGTLADITTRKTAATKEDGSINYGIFFDPKLVDTDVPRNDIIGMLNDYRAKGYEIIIVSGRSDRTREATVAWLDKYGVKYERLIMRPDSNYQDDAVLKKTFLTHYLDKSKCVAVVDDRPKVLRMWEDEGLNVVDVGNGVEF